MTSSALAIAPPAADEAPAPAGWSLARRIAFRFLVVYAIAYTFPFPLDLIPKSEIVVSPLYDGIRALDHWVADSVLDLDIPDTWEMPSGSGDRLLDYVHVLVMLVIATLGTAVWSALDRRRADYERLRRWLRIGIRYQLAFIMIGYGLAKVFKTQFPFPTAGDLAQPLGDGSPMGLVWNFMGYSTPYNWFTGGAEVLGGLLLFSRRTTTLGALVIIGVMTNVVMLNFCYDVPVKLFSTHLLLAAVYLSFFDLRRLTAVLVFNRPAPAQDIGPRLSRRWLLLKIAVIAWPLYNQLDGAWENYKEYGPGAPQPALAGSWEVSSMRRNGVELPPLETDEHRWRRLNVSPWSSRVVGMMPKLGKYFEMTYDEKTSTMTLSGGKEQMHPWVFHVTRDGDELHLEGFYEFAAVDIRLKKRSFLLETRGFHWVNEFPFNR